MPLSRTARNPLGKQGYPSGFEDALIWRDPWTLVEAATITAQRLMLSGTDYERCLSVYSRNSPPSRKDAQLAGVWAAERAEAWRPRAGTEIDNKTIPQNWTPAPPCTSRKDATRDKKPSRVTWGIHRAACSDLDGSLSTPCPQRAANSS